MGEIFSCCNRKSNHDDEVHLLDQNNGPYRPPAVATVVKKEAPAAVEKLRLDQTFGSMHAATSPEEETPPLSATSASPTKSSQSTQDLPPKVFKRLDKFLKDNGLRGRDVFQSLDSNKNKRITHDDIVTGLPPIGFKLSQTEIQQLATWLKTRAPPSGDSYLEFRDFTLALKLRTSCTSPPSSPTKQS